MAVLEDGQAHTIEEIHFRAGTMRLNSRVAELRKRGHEIVCSRAGDTYSYQLVSLDERSPGAGPPASDAEPHRRGPDSALRSSSEDGTSTLSESADCEAAASLDPSEESLAADSSEQLVLDVAA